MSIRLLKKLIILQYDLIKLSDDKEASLRNFITKKSQKTPES